MNHRLSSPIEVCGSETGISVSDLVFTHTKDLSKTTHVSLTARSFLFCLLPGSTRSPGHTSAGVRFLPIYFSTFSYLFIHLPSPYTACILSKSPELKNAEPYLYYFFL